MNYANSPSTLNFPKLTFCLTLAVLLFTATAQADITLSQLDGSYNWQFDFTNADGAKGSETGYIYYPELSQTFRLADAKAHFTSFTIDLNAIADIWFTNYAGPEVRDLPIPENFTASIAAELFINGQYVGDLGYDTGDSLVFNPNYIYFGGNDVVTTWDPTGEVSLNKSFDIDLSQFGETNELTLTWTVIYGDFTDIFENAVNPNDYCPSAYWDFDGTFNVSYTSEGGSASAPTPEPATMLIFGLGLAGLGLARRRRK